MAKAAGKTTKSESMTIRLDPKTRFILEYISRLKGQTITTVVERAIVDAASKQTIMGEDFDPDKNWSDFWDVCEGIRSLRMYEIPAFFPTYEEEQRLAFCKEHWPFFYMSKKMQGYRRSLLDVLWPRIDEFIAIHEERKSGGNYWAAGEAMTKVLNDADLRAPSWPIKEEPKSPASEGYDPDSEIPF
ncbi:hypothetical protein [Ahrensia sp. 13_GOM-1096m]|uniref:hypothetical protein n=1 Tax=Ahrensia sp. 13_GOM-1096m TaxID=1380380 RepID=UPI00047E2113|nr:hypothetical protein [Ahrensia sp. 13_GOM-1096m]